MLEIHTNHSSLFHNNDPDQEVYDLADLTPQCGRRGDALKLFLGWIYYGRKGYAEKVEHAFAVAQDFFNILHDHENFVLVSKSPLPCLQVCFYWASRGSLSLNDEDNTFITQTVAQNLIPRGFMIDYAPGPRGRFFRVVVSIQTRKDTVEKLAATINELAEELSSSRIHEKSDNQ
jgi:glutamate decarboxylase